MISPERARQLDCQIRPAVRTDLERIVQIEHESFPTPWPYDLLVDHLRQEGFLVAEVGGYLVGYIIVGMKIPSFFSRLERRTMQLFTGEEHEEPQIGHIMNIAIDPKYRKLGLAKALLRAGIAYLKQFQSEEIELEVRIDNAAAIALYERFGFTIKDQISNYYSDGDDAYLMNVKTSALVDPA